MSATVATSARQPFWGGLWLIVTLELRQRVRGVAWYVLLGVFFVIVGLVTVLLWFATNALESGGGGMFSTIIFFVLLLGSLVSPALSGNAINGDRDSGVLATTQVTLITTWQLVLGKFVAAWLTALAFLVAALPFLLFAVVLGEVSFATVAVSTLVLGLELGVIAAIGVGLSGIQTRPLFSIVTTYLVIAALSVGTLIVFGLAGLATQSPTTRTSSDFDWDNPPADEANGRWTCTDPVVYESTVPRFDYYWGVLAANPYVVVADAAPGSFDESGYPTDLFGWIATGVRSAQNAPELHTVYDACADGGSPQGFDGGSTGDFQTAEEMYNDAVPSWFVGLTIHLLLGAGALFWAYTRTNTPARRLPTGSRVA
ncbi:ABC-type transport system involved in multi-copper enzyme maturation permease subunit [Microterricola gilva]|uniref:ABC-type transport system involved in multi-copper enzyme maturation permease subunit n=1 Tax=Microterricola gilva TaxID=393267 RepID=A0A4Q8AMW4_9MICO|nr:ABC transporter permease [Microterricola gilva]RZU65924.1 ABC-type transport system involved in multi-copper enzyme maturation permease subunit [Microterricola gilva]